MVDEKIRKAILEYAKENDVEVIVLDGHAYDKSIIGIAEDGRAIYDLDKMVGELMEDEGWDEIDAIEWIEHNTLGALPYMGENAPIVIHGIDDVLEKYGDWDSTVDESESDQNA